MFQVMLHIFMHFILIQIHKENPSTAVKLLSCDHKVIG
jgi:hypothetical protein